MSKLRGIHTAIITPFQNDGSIDWAAFEILVGRQIEAGIDGIVFLGTTGESPTLTHKEHAEVLKWGTEKVNGRCTVILSIGSNSTAESIDFAKIANETKADYVMAVNPYYNKPNQEGLYQHFCAIADLSDLPVMLYNIKGRSAVNIETDTLLRLAKHPNITAVKEASGDLSQQIDVIRKVPDDFSVLIGDDPNVLPFMALGGDGLVSVTSNAVPKTLTKLVHTCMEGDYVAGRKMFFEIYGLMNSMMTVDVNPLGIKELMVQLGLAKPVFRLPMLRLSEEKQKEVAKWVEVVKGWEK